MKKKILLIAIILIIVCILTYYIGIYFGKKQMEEQLIEKENINNNNIYINNNFDFVRREKEDYKEIIPNTILKIKELDIKNKKIKISYTTYDKKEDNSNKYMLRSFVLEKQIQGKWFEIGIITKMLKQAIADGENIDIEIGKEYEEEFDISKLNKKIKFDKGNYRLVFESNADYSNKRYIMVEFEI